MDTPPKKRRFWQLHLSTMILVLAVALGLPILATVAAFMEKADAVSVQFDFDALILPVSLYAGILACVAFVCEYVIRRREAKKPPKRPWFRFHLLTAVLLMFTAGTLLWLEVNPPDSHPIHNAVSRQVPWQGWPWTARFELITLDNEEATIAIALADSPRFFWIWTNVAKDAAVCVLILSTVAFVSESLIRRREGRKP